MTTWDAVIIGGGFFGCGLALHLSARGMGVLIIEKEDRLLTRASFNNQARVHNGYHYPRSLLTGLRSRVNYPRFLHDYEDCIVDDFDHYYAIAAQRSNVTAAQFRIFCARIGAPLKPAPLLVRKLFSSELIEEIFTVHECAFDAAKLANKMRAQLEIARVTVEDAATVLRIKPSGVAGVDLVYAKNGQEMTISGKVIFNCTYSNINRLLSDSNLSTVNLKHEIAEIALIQVPEVFRNVAVTVMCGPFFSFMPFPPRSLHSLSHVRYTPHHQWEELAEQSPTRTESVRGRKTHYYHMIKDAARYLPLLSKTEYVDSLWETKTVLPSSEIDDSRPILFHRDPSAARVISIMGAKMDNIYDIFGEVDSMLEKEISL